MMRGDQLARWWRIIRANKASRDGLTVAEIARREGTEIRAIYRDLAPLQAAGFPLNTEIVDKANRWAFIDTFASRILPAFTLPELMSLFFYNNVLRVLKGAPFYNSLDSVFKKMQSTEINSGKWPTSCAATSPRVKIRV